MQLTVLGAPHPRVNAIRRVLGDLVSDQAEVCLVQIDFFEALSHRLHGRKLIAFDLEDEPEYTMPEWAIAYAKVAPSKNSAAIALPNEWLARRRPKLAFKEQVPAFSFIGRSTYLTYEEKEQLPKVDPMGSYKATGFDMHKGKWAYSQRIHWLHEARVLGLPVRGGLVDGPGYLSIQSQQHVFGDWSPLQHPYISYLDALTIQGTTKVSLCPAGHGTWTYRAYDAATLGVTIVAPNLQRPLLYPEPDVVVNPGEPLPISPDLEPKKDRQSFYSSLTREQVCKAFMDQLEAVL